MFDRTAENLAKGFGIELERFREVMGHHMGKTVNDAIADVLAGEYSQPEKYALMVEIGCVLGRIQMQHQLEADAKAVMGTAFPEQVH